LKSTVTRLKPRIGSFVESLEAFSSGDFVLSAELLSGGQSLKEAILLSRSLLRLGEPERATSVLAHADLSNVPHELAAEALVVRIASFNVLGKFEEAANLAVEARVRCISAGIAAIEAELLFIEALGHIFGNNYAAAEASAKSILDLELASNSWLTSKTYSFNLEYMRFRACDLLGSIEGSRSNYELQAKWLLRAFDEFDRSGVRDDYMEAVVLSNFADVAVGVGLAGVADIALARSKRIEWSSSLAPFEFRIFSALAQASSIAGDQLGALRFLRRCNNCAPTAALQLRSTVERARILSDIGESFSSREELDHAIRLSKSIDWAKVSEHDQRQLVFLAAQVAGHNATEASRLLARYDGLKTARLDMISIRDDRFRAEELVARSAVLLANGENTSATIALLDALEIFNANNDPVSAANTAAELALLTGESRYIEIARVQSEKQPYSILARKVARLQEMVAASAPS